MSSNQPIETKGCQGHLTRNPDLEEAIEVNENLNEKLIFKSNLYFMSVKVRLGKVRLGHVISGLFN
jgi:hypothetical protein